MDYNQSHVVKSIEYFEILEGKIFNKEATKEVRHQKWKERDDKKPQWVANSCTIINIIIQRLVNKSYRANFAVVWSWAKIKKTKDKFHNNFLAGFKAHPSVYKGINLEFITPTQKKRKARARSRV